MENTNMDKYQAQFEALLKDGQAMAVPIAVAKHVARIALFELTGLDALFPDLKDKVVQLMANMAVLGKPLFVVQTFRSAKSQDGLATQVPPVTKAKGLQSYHQYGLACDLAFVNYKFNPPSQDWWNTLEREAEKLGLISGNGWTGFVDKDHVEWHPNFDWSVLEAYFKTI